MVTFLQILGLAIVLDIVGDLVLLYVFRHRVRSVLIPRLQSLLGITYLEDRVEELENSEENCDDHIISTLCELDDRVERLESLLVESDCCGECGCCGEGEEEPKTEENEAKETDTAAGC